MKKSRILVLDDDAIVRRLAVKLLEAEGYEPLEAAEGRAGLSMAFTLKPDLILLDRVLPDMDGIEVLRRLRAHMFTGNIPVVMLTSRHDVEDRVEGLASGADDYIGKPFSKRELMARVSAAMRRSQHNLAADPLTKLPGNLVLREHLKERIESGCAHSVAYIDLDNFKAYVDCYGFEAAARVIQKAAQTLYNAVIDHGDPDDFIGHIGGDDFLLVSTPGKVEEVAAALVRTFDEHAPGFYSQGDRERGHIHAKDRYGTMRDFPIVSLSVAVIDVPAEAAPEPVDLAEFAAECKKEVKSDRGKGWRRYCYPTRGSEAG